MCTLKSKGKWNPQRKISGFIAIIDIKALFFNTLLEFLKGPHIVFPFSCLITKGRNNPAKTKGPQTTKFSKLFAKILFKSKR